MKSEKLINVLQELIWDLEQINDMVGKYESDGHTLREEYEKRETQIKALRQVIKGVPKITKYVEKAYKGIEEYAETLEDTGVIYCWLDKIAKTVNG